MAVHATEIATVRQAVDAGADILLHVPMKEPFPREVTKLERTITETFRQNVYVTPRGIFDYPQLKFCLEVLGADRIIHAVDCPFIANAGAQPFLENAPSARRLRK